MADIERIEVVRGPSGTIWGPNAVNGVVNVSPNMRKTRLRLKMYARLIAKQFPSQRIEISTTEADSIGGQFPIA